MHRAYFLAVGLFALWVGLFGYLFPALVKWAIPWQVPPLHARFIASMYLAGAVLMFGAARAANLSQIRIAVVMAPVWTGMLLLVSLLHLDEFDWYHPPVWFWFFAYVLYPVWGFWLAWRCREGASPVQGDAAAMPVRRFFAMVSLASLTLAFCLFFFPAFMVGLWPWPVTGLLAQIYSGPFMSFGVGAAMLSRCRHREEMRLASLSIGVFCVLVLLASLLHVKLFQPLGMPGMLWLTVFAIAPALLAMLWFSNSERQEDKTHA